ncbi:MAG: O-antigen ligase family protein [Proteobacteria bacterium]|nr:O-antigen ligase family protein [Pseudomonadota bacterium]
MTNNSPTVILSALLLAGVAFAILIAPLAYDLDIIFVAACLVMLFLIALILFCPKWGAPFFMLFLINHPVLSPYVPDYTSPALTILAALMVLGATRFLIQKDFTFNFDNKFVSAIIAFVAWTLLYAIANFGKTPRVSFVEITVPVIMFAAFSVLEKDQKSVTWAYGGLLVSTCIFCLFFLPDLIYGYQFVPGGFFRSELIPEEMATLKYTSLSWVINFSAALSFGLLLCGSALQRITGLFVFSLLAATSLLTFSRSAPMGLLGIVMAVCLILLLKRDYRSLAFIAVITLIVGTVFLSSPIWSYFAKWKSLEMELYNPDRLSRYWLALDGLKSVAEHPWLGKGAGGSPTHSYLIDIPWQYGIPAALLFYYAIWRLFRRSWLLMKNAISVAQAGINEAIQIGCFIAFCATIWQGIFNPVLRTPAYVIIFWLVRALENYYWSAQKAEIPAEAAESNAAEPNIKPAKP